MKRQKNSTKNLKIARLIFMVLVVFFCYLINVFYPSWTWHICHLNGQARIVEVDEQNKVVTYIYFNESKHKEITSKRRVKTKDELLQFRVDTIYSITYSNYAPQFVRFDFLDKTPNLSLTIGVTLIVLIGIILYLGVLLNRISLETLVGVKS